MPALPRRLTLDNLGERLLLAAYLLGAIAFLTVTDQPAQRLWAQMSILPFVVAAGLALAGRTRRWAAMIACLGAVLVPLIVLVLAASGQPEVQIVRDGAHELLRSGSPYVREPHALHEYRPYLPAMFAFGIGPGPLGDVRVWGAMMLTAGVALTLNTGSDYVVSGDSRASIRRVALLLACPIVAVAITTSGIDTPQAGLTLLALAAYGKGRWRTAGLAAGLSVALKPLGLCLVFVLAIAAHRKAGPRAARALVTMTAVTIAVALIPVLLVSPHALFVNVVEFPSGVTAVRSPADSPLPGVILRHAGLSSTGSTLLVLAAALIYALLCVALWKTSSVPGVAAQLALGFVLAFLVIPYSRAGYFALPALTLVPIVASMSTREKPDAPA